MYLFISFETRAYRIQGIKEEIIECRHEINNKKSEYYVEFDKFYMFEKRFISSKNDDDLIYIISEISEKIKSNIDLSDVKKIVIIYQKPDLVFKSIEIGKKSSERDIKNQLEIEFSRDMKLDLNKYKYFYEKIKIEETYDVISVKLVPVYLYELVRNIENNIGKKVSAFIIEEEIIEYQYKDLIHNNTIGAILRIGKTDIMLCKIDSANIRDVMLIEKKEIDESFVSYIKSMENMKVLLSDYDEGDCDFIRDLGFEYETSYNTNTINYLMENLISNKLKECTLFRDINCSYKNLLDYRSEKLLYYKVMIFIFAFIFFMNLFKLPNEYEQYIYVKGQANLYANSSVDRNYKNNTYKRSYKNIYGIDVLSIEKILKKIKSKDLTVDCDKKSIKLEFSVSNQKELAEILALKLNKKIKIEEIRKEERLEEAKKEIITNYRVKIVLV